MSITAEATELSFPHRHLLGIEGLSRDEIVAPARPLRNRPSKLSRQIAKKRDDLRGRTLINLFFEASTRTQSSFELAGKRLGADVMNMSSRHLVRAEGRDPDRHGGDAERHAPRHPRRAPPCRRRRRAARPEGRLLGDQCRRRQPRAPDPGAARCAHHPPPQGPHRRADRGDLRRHPAFARRPLQHPAAQHARRPRPRRRALDAARRPASSGSASRSIPRCARAWRTPTSS